jgi:BlaI family transcriptional regulator, penicillinase repressor
MPVIARRTARSSALRHLIETFFDGSPEKVVTALLGGEGAKLSDEQVGRIAEMIEKVRKDGAR